MPEKNPCPKCAVIGHNRMEYVIHAGQSYRSFECQACGHQWRVLETGEHVPTTREDIDPPDRSRPSTPRIDPRRKSR